MKQIKKILFTLVLTVLGAVALMACKTKPTVDLAGAKEKLAIVYTSPDTALSVKSKVTLPTTVEGFEGVSVAWESDKPAVISTAGVVTRQDANEMVKLTATLTAGKKTDTKIFELTVIKKDPVVESHLAEAKAALEVTFAAGETATTVTQNVTLPTTTAFASVTVSWASDKPAVVSNAGVVTQQAENTTVVLTATLTEGSETATKTFTLTVLAEVVVDKTQLKALLDAHYAESLAIHEFRIETETINLVDTIGDFSVTWTSNNPDVINVETGAVTRPAFSPDGDASVILIASAEGQNSRPFVVVVPQLEETLDAKLENELTRLTTFPSSYRPILKVTDLKLGELKKVMVDGAEVTEATWVSNDPTYFDDLGVRKDAEFEGEKEVSFTVTFTYQEITKTKTVTFTIMGVYVFDSITNMLYSDNKASTGDVVKLTGVSYYTHTEDGYYIVDKDGILLFNYGTTGKPAADKVFDVKFELDIYFGTPQMKTPTYEEKGGVAFTPNITEITLADLVAKETPSESKPLLTQLYKVTGSKLHVFSAGTERYKTFLVPQTHNDPTKEPNKSDSMMVYYQTPGGLALLQGLADGEKTYSKNFEHIVIIVNAFRTNNDIYAFMFLGDINNEDDLKLSLNNTDKAEQALRNAANKIESQILLEGQDYTLTASETFDGHNYSVTYTSGKPTVVGHDGKVVAGQFPAPGNPIEIEFTLTTNSIDDVEVTYKRTVKLGRDASVSIDAAVAKAEKDVVFFEAMWFGISGGTHVFVDGTSEQGAAVRFPNTYDQTHIVAGKKYLIYATKAADFNGLKQFNGVLAVELSDEIINPVDYTKALTKAELEKVMNQVVRINGLTLVAAPAKDDGVLTYSLKNAAGEIISIREHQDNLAVIAAIEALNLQAGDRVNMVSGVVSWFKNPQFLLVTLEKAPLTPEEQFNEKVAAFKLTLPAENKKYNENFNLAVAHDGLAIAWEVTEGATAAAVDAAGLVTITKGAEEVTVKLKGVVTEGEFTAEVLVTVVIAKEGDVPVAEPITVTTVVAASEGNFAEDQNIASDVGLNSAIFDVRAIKNEPGQNIGSYSDFRLYSVRATGNGNTLSISVDETTHKIISVEFVISQGEGTAKLMLGSAESTLAPAQLTGTLKYEDLDISSFSLQNIHEGGSKNLQIRIASITITYVEV